VRCTFRARYILGSLHEAIHGFFDAIGGFSELSQHQGMLIGWVDCEQNALKELFPNLTDANALCLIFGGMGDMQANDGRTGRWAAVTVTAGRKTF